VCFHFGRWNSLVCAARAAKIVKRDGISGLYSGLSAAILRQSIYSTTRFGIYDIVKRRLGETKAQRIPYYRKVAATMIGGTMGAVVSCPTDVMLVRMQADGRLPIEQRRNYRNVFHALHRVARDEGLRAWFRGLGPLMVRGLSVTTAQFATYDQSKEFLQNTYQAKDTFGLHITSSLIAGFTAAIVSTPLDVIKVSDCECVSHTHLFAVKDDELNRQRSTRCRRCCLPICVSLFAADSGDRRCARSLQR
jgi:solute carrier family 25 oxoglutarate transporter 11